MTGDTDGAVAGQDGMLEPTDVAKCVVKAIQVRHLRVQSHLTVSVTNPCAHGRCSRRTENS